MPNLTANSPDNRSGYRKSAVHEQICIVELGPDRSAMLLDVSELGIGVQCVQGPPETPTTPLRFLLPGSPNIISGEGEIAWADLRGRMGIRFTRLAPEMKQHIHEWVLSEDNPLFEDPVDSGAIADEDARDRVAQLEARIMMSGWEQVQSLNFLVDQIAAMTQASGVAIAVEDGHGIVCKASSGIAPQLGVRINARSGLSWECARKGDVVHCVDTETDPRVDRMVCRELNMRSAMLVPVITDGKVTGLVEVFSSRPRAFSTNTIVLLKRVAEAVGALDDLSSVMEAPLLEAPLAEPPQAMPLPPPPRVGAPVVPQVVAPVSRGAAAAAKPAPIPVPAPAAVAAPAAATKPAPVSAPTIETAPAPVMAPPLAAVPVTAAARPVQVPAAPAPVAKPAPIISPREPIAAAGIVEPAPISKASPPARTESFDRPAVATPPAVAATPRIAPPVIPVVAPIEKVVAPVERFASPEIAAPKPSPKLVPEKAPEPVKPVIATPVIAVAPAPALSVARADVPKPPTVEPVAAPEKEMFAETTPSESGVAARRIGIGIAAAIVLAVGIYEGVQWMNFGAAAKPSAVQAQAAPVPAIPNPLATQPASTSAAVQVASAPAAGASTITSQPPAANAKPPQRQPVSIEVYEPTAPVHVATARTSDPEPAPITAAPLPIVTPNTAGVTSILSGSVAVPTLGRTPVSEGVTGGKQITRIDPRYPTSARVMRITGTVVLRAHISKAGTVSSVDVISGNTMLVSAAVEAVRRWRYQPFLLNGRPIENSITVQIRFNQPE